LRNGTPARSNGVACTTQMKKIPKAIAFRIFSRFLDQKDANAGQSKSDI
jgi:hypothetical protein